MKQPEIAVVISTYNKVNFLKLVLEGYRNQTDLNFSIYIADDGSDKKTAGLITQMQADFPVPIKHVWHQDDGFRKARIHNIAIQHITQPYVLLTDGDCIPRPQMIEVHRKIAKQDCLISGGRVLLSQSWTGKLCEGETELNFKASFFEWLSLRLRKSINRMLPLVAPYYVAQPNQKLHGIRGCHISCWLKDLKKINGFDEHYKGWGREDSDLVARLFHANIYRLNLHNMPVLHLWHQEEERSQLNENDQLLKECLEIKRIEATQGLRQLQESL